MVWQVLTWRRPRSSEHRDWLRFQASVPSPRAEPVAGRMWEAMEKSLQIFLFLENKHFQRPWWAFSLNKANSGRRAGERLFLPATATFQWSLWFGLEQCIQRTNRKDGELSCLEEQFSKRGPIDIPRSFILQSYPLDSERSASAERHSLFWVGYALSDRPARALVSTGANARRINTCFCLRCLCSHLKRWKFLSGLWGCWSRCMSATARSGWGRCEWLWCRVLACCAKIFILVGLKRNLAHVFHDVHQVNCSIAVCPLALYLTFIKWGLKEHTRYTSLYGLVSP